MKITNIEAGTIVVLLIAGLGGAVYIGKLEGRINGLEGRINGLNVEAISEAISKERDEALSEIDALTDNSLARIKEMLPKRRWLDTMQDRTSACEYVDDHVQYCQASNELAYPITVTIVTENEHRPKEEPTTGCGVAIHLVEDKPDWHTPQPGGDAKDPRLAHMVTIDRGGICWAAATVPAGSEYYVKVAYKDVYIESWLEFR